MIKAFDKVCEVQSDKATVEITSRFGGIVARVYSVEGDVVKVTRFLHSFIFSSSTIVWLTFWDGIVLYFT